MLLALMGAVPTAAGTWTTEFEGTLGRVGDGGYTQVLSHDGALWVSTQSYGDDNVNVRNFDGAPGISEADALIAYLQMLGTLVDFSTFTPVASR